jgi:hypothetical protein
VCVALGTHHAMHMRHIVISACTALHHFSTLFHKRCDFRKTVTQHKIYGQIFSTNLTEMFFILMKIERDIIKSVYTSSCKVPLLLWSDFNET